MPESCLDMLKPNVFSLPDKLLRHSAKLKPLRGPHERKSKKGVKSELSFGWNVQELNNFILQKSNRIQSSAKNAKSFARSS